MTSPHAKNLTGCRMCAHADAWSAYGDSLREHGYPFGPCPETDNLTSFGPITDEEAEDFKELMRIDRASVYAT